MQSRIPEIASGIMNQREQQTKDQLARLFEQYALDKCLYTEHIQIDERAIPHSHPVLTLNTPYPPDDPQALLAKYIHEQIHWFVLLVEKAEDAYKAMGIFRQMHPDLPVGFPDGCRDGQSNYLHIEVNYLEYMGLIELFGSEAASQVIERKDYYKKIYETILHDTEKVAQVMTHHELILPEHPPEQRDFLHLGA
ncbi:hypothetical protein KSD_65550 [Ktedonobacter sp. SOSP1-85]|uniref:hypothetical protein n=1 Tax=Ktedonobacter sp. SOSP1-85 TaxID=2778367 RepID=UPI0019159606|nr:hypothetical protein [Ktedonobacter sp. SOSP1-85]GHO78784.1 hypothetical protein KSD_65550 [Ktedonobacter sp. SOSP1-85]